MVASISSADLQISLDEVLHGINNNVNNTKNIPGIPKIVLISMAQPGDRRQFMLTPNPFFFLNDNYRQVYSITSKSLNHSCWQTTQFYCTCTWNWNQLVGKEALISLSSSKLHHGINYKFEPHRHVCKCMPHTYLSSYYFASTIEVQYYLNYEVLYIYNCLLFFLITMDGWRRIKTS